MDLLDTLLNQRLFVVSLSLPGVILLAAIVLAILPRLRKTAIQARARRQAKAATRQEEQSRKQQRRLEEATEAPSGRITEEDQDAQDDPIAREDVDKEIEVPDEANQEQDAQDETETSASEPAVKAGEMIPSEMQEILSSVFEDEDQLHRYDVLLRGQKDIDVFDLLAMSRRVSERLQQGDHAS